MLYKGGLLFAVALALGACSYNAQVADTPSFNVASSYGERVPGTWLLYVEASKLDQPTKTSSYECSAHKFPIAAAGSFRSSVQKTLGNVVERVQLVDGPMPASAVKAQGARGLIIVRGEEVRPKMDVQPGFWSANMAAQATVIASVTVDGHKGRLFGQTVEGQGFANGDAGLACEGGGKALASAIGQAMGDTMRKIGEAISNSERVRTAPSV